MADQQSILQLLIELQDRISEPLEHVQHSMEEVQHSFAEVTKAGTEVFAGFEALEHIIEPAMEMQNAQARLAQATDASAEALAEAKEQAEGLSTSYARSAEDITAAQTTLARYTGSLDAAEESMKATAQIADIFGISVDQAAKLMGPAMQTIGDATLPVGERMQQVADKIAVLTKSMPADAGAGMARSLGQAAGETKKLGLSIDQTLASVAVLQKTGVVRNAGTSFKQLAEEMLKAGKDGENAFQKAGVHVAHLGNLKGPVNLIDTLRALQAKGPAAVQAFAKSMGDQGGLFELLMQNLDGVADGTQKLHNASGAAAEEAGKNQDTLSQQLGNMRNALSNLADAFGTPLIGPLTHAIEVVTSFINTVKDFAEAHPAIAGLISNFLGIVAAMIAVQGALRAVMLTLRLFGATSLVAMGPLMILAAAAVAAAIAIYQNWDYVKEKLAEVWAWFSNTSFGQGVIAVAQEIARVAREIPAAWDWVKEKVSVVWAWFENSTWAQATLAALAPFIGIPLAIYEHWGPIKDFFQTLWDEVTAIFQSALGKIQPVINAVTSAVNLARSVGGKVAEAFSSAPQVDEFGRPVTAPGVAQLATSAPAGTGGGTQGPVNSNNHTAVTNNFSIQGSADPNATAQAVADKLAEQARQNSRDNFAMAPGS